MPEVRLVSVEPLIGSKECEIVVVFSNPSQQPTTISFITYEEAEEEAQQQIEVTPDTSVAQGEAPPSLSSLTRSPPVMEDPRPVNVTASGDVHLPTADIEIALAPQDVAAEYDDSVDNQKFHDDPK